jgi:crossover junction endodeoxyribonuclease RuvC
MAIRVLGIDPGLTRCGVGVVDVEPSRKVKMVSVGVFKSDTGLDAASRVGSIGALIAELIDQTKPQSIAIERVYADSNVSTVMGTAQISGVVMFLAHQRGIPVTLHTPTEVKAAVTGSGRANKEQVGKMVASILGLKEVPKPADAADSLAIAICHAWRALATGSGAASESITPAQKAWRAAELASIARSSHRTN